MRQQRGFQAGLTTNARDPGQVMALADAGLMQSFGVSAGKGEWTVLASHPRAVKLIQGGVQPASQIRHAKLRRIFPIG